MRKALFGTLTVVFGVLSAMFAVVAIAAVLLTLTSSAHAAEPHSVTLNWEDTKNPATTTYRMYRIPGLCPVTPLPATSTLTPIATDLSAKTYVDNTVVPANYCYFVTAFLNAVESLPSAPALASVPSWEPTELTVTSVTSDTVALTWKDTRNPAGSLYNVYRASGLCSGTPAFSKLASGITALELHDKAVTPGHYCYRVSAIDNSVESAVGNSVLASVPAWPPDKLSIIAK